MRELVTKAVAGAVSPFMEIIATLRSQLAEAEQVIRDLQQDRIPTPAAPEAESEKEESRTVPPAPVLLPAEPPLNPGVRCRNCGNSGVGLDGRECPCRRGKICKDAPATPEPQAAEGRRFGWMGTFDESGEAPQPENGDPMAGTYRRSAFQPEPTERLAFRISRTEYYATNRNSVADHDGCIHVYGNWCNEIGEAIIAYLNGTSPLHSENSRLAAQVEELTKDRDQLQKLLDMHARVCTAPSSTAAESGDWEKEFDERYFMDLDGHLRIRDGVDGIFSRNRNASLADIKAFIRKHVASPKQAAAVEGTGEPLEVERYRTKQQRGQGDLIGAAAPTPALPAETPTESRKAWRAVNERYMQPANYDCWGLSMEGRMATQAEAEEAAARANKTF